MQLLCSECWLWESGLNLQDDSLFNVMVQKQGYDIQIRWKNEQEVNVQQKWTDSLSPRVDPLESVAAQSCLEMNFTTEEVSKAIDTFHQRHGDINFKAKDLCEILLEIEEQEDTSVKDKKITTISAQPTNDPEANNHDLFNILFDQIHPCRMCKTCDIVHISLIAYHHLSSCPQCSMF